MHTILYVAGRTKDSKNSMLDLPAICKRSELHITDDGEIQFPIFRMESNAKAALFRWVKEDVKFPDEYVSNLLPNYFLKKLMKHLQVLVHFSGICAHVQ
ncbi:hypothetical protein V5N11_016432 [Cardamine amara subsp. amara]|uniref:Uncharacterized protein n=1 Tax=Cardamine amara subsp. amara TaxID=228776 RepID=A0ABD1AEA0_CARAN